MNAHLQYDQTNLDKACAELDRFLRTRPGAVQEQSAACELYKNLFDPSNVANITKEDFRNFLAYKHNLHWKNIHRQPRIYEDMPRLQRALSRLLDEGSNIQDRLDSLDKGGQYYIPGLGKAVLTPILMCVYPEKYGVYNRISEGVLIWLRVLKAKPMGSLGKRYVEVNKACLQTGRLIKRPLSLADTMYAIANDNLLQ